MGENRGLDGVRGNDDGQTWVGKASKRGFVGGLGGGGPPAERAVVAGMGS